MRFNLTEFLSSLDKQKIILIFIISAGLLYADFAYLMKSQFDGLKSKDPKIVKLKKDIETLNKDIANAKALLQMPGAAAKENVTFKKVISPDGVPSLLENITKLARKYGVSITQISSPKATEAPKSSKPEAVMPYLTVAISIEASCDYHALGGFISELNQLPAIITVSEMSIVPGGEDSVKQNVILELKTYVKK